MVFEVPMAGGGVVDQHTIDLSQCASLLNRRFYRQGINWAVSGFKFVTLDTVTGIVAVKKLPSTWVMSNAWEKSFRSWQEMNEKALEDTESIRPRFMDFKIYADDTHHNVGYAGNLLPGVLEPAFTPAVPGEWESSKITIPTNAISNVATDFELIAVGASFQGASTATTLDAVSLIEGYAASRGLPYTSDPNVPDDADDVGPSGTPENWMGALNNDGSDQDKDVLDRMVGAAAENNQAPYPFENDGTATDTMYPGGANQLNGLQFHDTEFITGTTIGGVSRLKGGMFPCGLVRIQTQKNAAGQGLATLLVDLVPGHHRGYLCEPMTEM
jgi:hypothetical protein